MKAKLIRYPGRKWLKHEALWAYPNLRDHLPDTMLFSQQAFIDMIDKYKVVFVKPDLGMQGKGVMKVTTIKENGGGYVIRTADNAFAYRDVRNAAKKLSQLIGHQQYLVQQGIDLIRLKGKPIDFRALLHIKPDGNWRFFGIMGKVAAANQIVTNYNSGGRAIQLHQALELSIEESHEWEMLIKQLSGQFARAMKKSFPRITELGLDLAIDTKGQIWLLEANTKPHYKLFRHHSNPSLFAKIASSARSIRSSGA
ncbi:YheC/YheD family protein [Paenibacillus kobensis]|uniref:YheC/YheD family protein n=1 Tax=Paenibacillus kobensis TaxID=59841 RepID=UPI000FD8CA94|nr:YheC/YheD family protein [Paenibacillus kobensis]